MTKEIDKMSASSGRMLGEDDSAINVAEEIKGINAKLGAGSNLGGNPISETNPLPVTSTDDEYEHIVVTIAANASESDPINIKGFKHLAFRILGAWTPANVYYKGDTSGNANNFSPVIADGQEVNGPVAADQCISVVGNALALAPYDVIKICSGPSSLRVPQAAARTIEVQVKR